MPTYLHIVCGCIHTTTTELQVGLYGLYPEVITLWSYKKKFADPWTRKKWHLKYK